MMVLRARNIIIILIANYLLLVVVSAVSELYMIDRKAKELQTYMSTAGDMALQQTQMVDDILAKTDSDNTSTIMMPKSTGEGFVKTPILEGMYGLEVESDYAKQIAFELLYATNDLNDIAVRTGAIRSPVRYTDPVTGLTNWYYIPKIAMVGTDILVPSKATMGVKDAEGNYISSELASKILDDYGLTESERLSGDETYFITPVNIGITYINEELLSQLFVNNMDLMMRVKYQGKNLNTVAGGNGVLKGETYSDRVEDKLSSSNPINNGSFTYLRGKKVAPVSNVDVFEGVKPSVLYKVIDMYNPANDAVLSSLFGADKHGYASKAEYLKSLDSTTFNPATNQPYATKPIVVAKVTFYADVVIPYFTLIMRDLRSTFSEGSNNLIDIGSDNGKGEHGTRRISYTRYFAVTP